MIRLPSFLCVRRPLWVISASLFASAIPAQVVPNAADYAAADAVMANVRSTRPRLLANSAEVAAVRSAATAAPTGTALWSVYDRLQVVSGDLLSISPVSYSPGSLLSTARTALWRIQTLAIMGTIDNRPAWRARGKQELLAICSFPNWRPEHFLDTAEIMAAAAIGFDWLYGDLSASERTTVSNALIAKGIQPGMAGYQSGQFWAQTSINWSAVCNGAMVMAALAVADTQPTLARDVLARARHSVLDYLNPISVDGASVEGGYGDYALTYIVYALSSLRSVGNADLNLNSASRAPLIGKWRLHMGGVTRRIYNYGNNGEFNVQQPGLLWIANKFNVPEFAACQKELIKINGPHPLNLLWWHAGSSLASLSGVPASATFPEAEMTVLRRSWDPNSLQVAVKGGNNLWNHNQMDLGSFALDALNERWGIELGGDPASIGLPRDQYEQFYRVKTAGQNTIAFNGQNQYRDGTSVLEDVYLAGNSQFAIVDLSNANLGNTVNEWRRGVWLKDEYTVVFQDEFVSTMATVADWSMHTRAAVSILSGGRQATLTQNGKRLHLYVVAPSSLRFAVAPINVGPGEAPNPGVTRLGVRLLADGGSGEGTKPVADRLVIAAWPDVPGAPGPASVPVWPLSEWRARIAGP